MASKARESQGHGPISSLKLFWWAFALQGAMALLFAGLLFFVRTLQGMVFSDPVMLVYLSLLLGFYVVGNGLLMAVAGIFARQHQLRHWKLLLAEGCFAVALGAYIGITLLMTARSLAFLAGIHAVGVGFFQAMLALRLRQRRSYLVLLASSATVCVAVGLYFLTHRYEEVETITEWLSGFELFYGLVAIVFAVQIHRTAWTALTD